MLDWADMTSQVVAVAPVGFDRVAALVRAGMEFFATHADFVVIWRREAIEGGGRLEGAMAEHMRPFLDRAIAFLEREMAAGRLREHDPSELMQIVYGAVSTYFSDAGFRCPAVRRRPDVQRRPASASARAHGDVAGRAGSTLSRPLLEGLEVDHGVLVAGALDRPDDAPAPLRARGRGPRWRLRAGRGCRGGGRG